jgi:hypothetical protein
VRTRHTAACWRSPCEGIGVALRRLLQLHLVPREHPARVPGTPLVPVDRRRVGQGIGLGERVSRSVVLKRTTPPTPAPWEGAPHQGVTFRMSGPDRRSRARPALAGVTAAK